MITLKTDQIIGEPQRKNEPSEQRGAKDGQKRVAGESGSVIINLVISPNNFHVVFPEDDLEENNFYNDRFRGYED
ncbi:hypothetical protein [Desulfolucanica intricata]|uniref:hypothetical protein n=1 Tax=Desulfolucanica intricata TaxID=1285191 RepID=UPI00082EFD59|nr:hypothetical protein [Desulfolucanica intricata]